MLSALITAAFALVGTALTVFFGNKSTEKNIKSSKGVIIYRIDRLEERVEDMAKTLCNLYKERSFEYKRPKGAALRLTEM